MWVAIIITIIFLSGFIGYWIYQTKKIKIQQPIPKPTVSRREGNISGAPIGSWIFDPSVSGYIELTNLKIDFQFEGDALPFTPHPPSLNHFQCDQSILTYTKENTTIDFVLSVPNPVKIFNMSFAFLYDHPHDNNKPVILGYNDSVTGDTCYITKCLFEPIVDISGGGTLTVTSLNIENPIIVNDIMYFKLSISSDTENVSRIYLHKIMGFELTPTDDKDEYGSDLFPVITKIKGSFGPS